MTPAILRGTGIGSLLGILPGGGAVIASFVAYASRSRPPSYASEFGKGAIEGVAAPRPPTTPARRPRSSRMLTLGSRECRHGADDRRHDHAQHPPGPQVMT